MPTVSFQQLDVLAFVVLPVLMVLLLAWGTWAAWRRAGEPSIRAWRAAGLIAAAAAVWMAVTWEVASFGVLRQWNATPPPLVILMFTMMLIAVRLAFSTVGARLARHVPLWALVGVQSFRYPLELAMHSMAEQGIMPAQMSYSGRNFDIVTGATAVVVAGAILSGRAGRRLALAWNILGTALLLNIIVVAVLSTPLFAYFGEGDRLNVWITYPPFVWLPTVLVLAALAGHLVIFRAVVEYRT